MVIVREQCNERTENVNQLVMEDRYGIEPYSMHRIVAVLSTYPLQSVVICLYGTMYSHCPSFNATATAHIIATVNKSTDFKTTCSRTSKLSVCCNSISASHSIVDHSGVSSVAVIVGKWSWLPAATVVRQYKDKGIMHIIKLNVTTTMIMWRTVR